MFVSDEVLVEWHALLTTLSTFSVFCVTLINLRCTGIFQLFKYFTVKKIQPYFGNLQLWLRMGGSDSERKELYFTRTKARCNFYGSNKTITTLRRQLTMIYEKKNWYINNPTEIRQSDILNFIIFVYFPSRKAVWYLSTCSPCERVMYPPLVLA